MQLVCPVLRLFQALLPCLDITYHPVQLFSLPFSFNACLHFMKFDLRIYAMQSYLEVTWLDSSSIEIMSVYLLNMVQVVGIYSKLKLLKYILC